MIRLLATILVLGSVASPVWSQADVDTATARGLAWLARQQRDDGSFQRDGPRIAITAIATLAFMADGHTPDVGRYGLILRRAINHLIEQTPADGYIGRVDNSQMYGQAIVAIALIEAASLESDAGPRRAAMEAAVRLIDIIIRAQQIDKSPEHAGGWRYQPDSADSDLSVTHWCLMALRAARAAGLDLPAGAIDRASQYFRKGLDDRTGGFGYQPGKSAGVGPTAAAIWHLDRATTDRALSWLVQQKLERSARFFYIVHLELQCAAIRVAPALNPAASLARRMLVSMQQNDGSWPDLKQGEPGGNVYATATSTLSLSLPRQILPSLRTTVE